MTIQPGEFWVAEIPFTDARGSKKRPVRVLWLDGHDVVAAAVTSAPARTSSDVPLADWTPKGDAPHFRKKVRPLFYVYSDGTRHRTLEDHPVARLIQASGVACQRRPAASGGNHEIARTVRS